MLGEAGGGGGGHGVFDVVAAAYRNFAGVHQQFLVEPDPVLGEEHARGYGTGAAEPERRRSGERSVAHAGGVVGVEDGEGA